VRRSCATVQLVSSGNVRPDTLDPALLRPGRLDRRVEFSLPDAEGRAHILRIHARRYARASLGSNKRFINIDLKYER